MHKISDPSFSLVISGLIIQHLLFALFIYLFIRLFIQFVISQSITLHYITNMQNQDKIKVKVETE